MDDCRDWNNWDGIPVWRILTWERKQFVETIISFNSMIFNLTLFPLFCSNPEIKTEFSLRKQVPSYMKSHGISTSLNLQRGMNLLLETLMYQRRKEQLLSKLKSTLRCCAFICLDDCRLNCITAMELFTLIMDLIGWDHLFLIWSMLVDSVPVDPSVTCWGLY